MFKFEHKIEIVYQKLGFTKDTKDIVECMKQIEINDTKFCSAFCLTLHLYLMMIVTVQ